MHLPAKCAIMCITNEKEVRMDGGDDMVILNIDFNSDEAIYLQLCNQIILGDLVENRSHYNLILSERVDHLKYLYSQLPPDLRAQAAVIDGKMTSKRLKAEREQAIEDMRTGDKRYLFATYSLAKEGLDIPRLDRLYLVTPQKDYAVIVQSVGRVARVFDGKEQPMVYDYVDYIRSLQKSYKKRCTSYRKCGCEIKEE